MKSAQVRAARAAAASLVLLGAAALASACRGGAAQEADTTPAVAVRVADVEHRAIARPIVAPGTFGPKDEPRLSFKIGGVVERVGVEVGDDVREGQTLAALDLREIDAALWRARSAAEKAERDLERARRLYADSVVTLAQLQDAETGADVARADVAAAEFNHRYAVITAPADGVILERNAEPGETVAPGTAILVLGSRERGAVVRVGLSDRDVVRIRPGDRATARFDATGERVYAATVTEMAAAATPGTGTYAVELTVREPGRLVAGMVGRVEIVPSETDSARVVPVEALLEADGSKGSLFVLSEAGARALRREVTVAYLDGSLVAVTSGLEDVASVVTDGASWLEDGQAVRVVP
jgi:RND family efflux transporter MFP subunit